MKRLCFMSHTFKLLVFFLPFTSRKAEQNGTAETGNVNINLPNLANVNGLPFCYLATYLWWRIPPLAK